MVFGMVRYAPTQPENLLKNKGRQALYEYLRARPGATISELCKENHIPWGTAQHHLYLLARAGLVKSTRQGRTHLYFDGSLDDDNREILSVLRHRRALQIAGAIMQGSGMRQKDLCDRFSMTRKVFRHHLQLMILRNLIIETRRGKTRSYYPSPTLEKWWSSVVPAPETVAVAGAAPAQADLRGGESAPARPDRVNTAPLAELGAPPILLR